MAYKLKLDKTGKVFDSISDVAKYFGVTPQTIAQFRNYKSDKINHFWYKDVGITILEPNRQSIKDKKIISYENALKKIISMEQRICIDPLSEIIDDILVIAKRGMKQPII